MIKNLITISVLLFFLFCNCYSQKKEINFDFDYCVFGYTEDIVLELYYSFYISDLTLGNSESGTEVAGMMEIGISDQKTQEKIFDRKYKVPYLITDTVNYDKSRKITGQLNLSLQPGNYIVKVVARDFYKQSNYTEREESVFINTPDKGKPVLSDIQLCESVDRSSDVSSPFYKNGLEVFPNPSRFFSYDKNNLAYYYEIYGLKNLGSEFYRLILTIDLADSLLRKFETDYKVKNDSKAEYGQLDISGLKSGKYRVMLRLISSEGTELASKENYFWIYNKEDFNIASDGFEMSEYYNMNEETVNKEFEYIGYLLSDKLKTLLKTLKNIDEKKAFLYRFWKELESVQGNLNFKKVYFERIKFANENFGSKFEEGWKSDRGRIYCKYGKPDEIEKYDFESKTLPYEIWRYNLIQNGIIFVFGDLSSGANNYRLLHSTALGELKDEDWKRRITR
ncbi:MAG: GWxTD domain-containing protein [Ignavibacteria bacterium]|nr:GWxTD domain-containing protein [Ignavibacteria bacterium]